MSDNETDIQKLARLAAIRAAAEAEPEPEEAEPEAGDDEPSPDDDAPPPRWQRPQEEDVQKLEPRQLRRAGDPLGQMEPQHRPANWQLICPVRALGTANGTYYYLDPLGQVRDAKAGEHGQSHIEALFSPHDGVLDHWWPRFSKDSGWVGCRYELVRRDLFAACSRAGIWSPFGRLRGVGAWRGDDGELVLHLGNAIWCGPTAERDAETIRPGLLGKHVYSAGETQPKPAFERPPEHLLEAAPALLSILETWNWRRYIDPRLLLGWIGAAMIGGALDWRPAVWLTGDASTGKSTLQKVVGGLFAGGLVQSADATGAGIWQVVGMSSLPVAIDELEPSDSPWRTKAVIDLARQAASGAVILRGGQDHTGVQFRAQSAFLFSSILIPPMTPADRSRLAILELDDLPKGATLPDLTPRRLEAIGAFMRARLVQAWPKLAPTLQQFRAALAKIGHTNRSADQFGTLMTIAHLLLSDEQLDDEQLDEMVAPLASAALSETADKLADWQEWLIYLTSKRVDAFRAGQRRSISKLIADAANEMKGGTLAASEANDVLQSYGLKVYRPDHLLEGLDAWYLAVANKNSALAELHSDDKWAKGVWSQPASRVPGACKWKTPLKIDGVNARCTLLPLHIVQDPTRVSATTNDRGPGGGGPTDPSTPPPSPSPGRSNEGGGSAGASTPPEPTSFDTGWGGEDPGPYPDPDTLELWEE